MRTPVACRMTWLARAACLALLLLPGAAAAQEGMAEPQGAPERVRVGIFDRPPFAIRTADGAWLGMGVDLWRMTAEDLGLAYDYVEIDRSAVADALASGQIDLALPVDATPALAESHELTLPFFTATLGVASPQQSQIMQVVRGFASYQFLRLVGGLSVLLLVVGAIIWLLERRRNTEQFGGGILRGLGDGFWWAGVTLTTIGYGDKAPITLAGRAVAMLWMLVGLAVSAALTAAVVSMAGADRRSLDLPEARHGERVGTVAGSTAERFLERAGLGFRSHGSIPEALRALEAGGVDMVAAGAPALEHHVNAMGGVDTSVQTTRLDPQYVSFALPAGSELRQPVNRALLARLTSESGWNVIERYLPEE